MGGGVKGPLASVLRPITWTLGRPLPAAAQVVEEPFGVEVMKTPTSVATTNAPPSETTALEATPVGRLPVMSV